MRLRRPLAAGILGCLAVVGWATPAAAHAAVTASSPAQGAHLAHIPHTVTINFDQPVQPDDGGLVVLNSAAALVITGKAAGMESGIRLANELLDSGLAMEKLRAIQRFFAR